jgi:hypothetical protein
MLGEVVGDDFGAVWTIVFDDDDLKFERAEWSSVYCFCATSLRMKIMMGRFSLSL